MREEILGKFPHVLLWPIAFPTPDPGTIIVTIVAGHNLCSCGKWGLQKSQAFRNVLRGFKKRGEKKQIWFCELGRVRSIMTTARNLWKGN